MYAFFILALIELSASSLYLFESMLPVYFAPNPEPAPNKTLSKLLGINDDDKNYLLKPRFLII